MKHKILTLILLAAFCLGSIASAQITLLSSFDPGNIGTLCGIGYDPGTSQVWVYSCNSDSIHKYDASGNSLGAVFAPGGSANDVDVEIAPVQFVMNGNTIPQGQLLFINGETDSAEIYAIDNATGTITDTLSTSFGTDHVVGGSYHPIRNTFFMVQDNVPATALENLVAEIDPSNGDTLQTFQVTDYMSVYYGDIEVGASGNLFIVSSDDDSIAEFLPVGTFVQKHALPAGVDGLSGIALDCDAGEAWVSGNSGTVYHLGNFPCGTTGIKDISEQDFYFSNTSPNPFSTEINFSIVMKEAGKLKITLVNTLGKEVKIINDAKVDSGKQDFSITEKSLTPGIYFLKAEGDNFTACKRIVCMK